MKTLHSLSSFISAFENASKGRQPSQTFDDFLTLCMCQVTKNPHGEGMYYKDEFSRIVREYAQSGTYDDLIQLPSIFSRLVLDRIFHPDMIGEFYMTAIAPETNKTILSPFPLCLEIVDLFRNEIDDACEIFDTSVGTGRMLLALEKISKFGHSYFGIDTTPLLVKLAAVNMFMHGLSGEVICAQGADLENFVIGYTVTANDDTDEPKGIIKFEDEDELIMCLTWNDFVEMRKENPKKRLLFL